MAKVCTEPGCPALRPCETHQRKPWQGSNRRAELPPDWPRIRQRILRRDPICRACMAAPSAEVDHIDNPHDHSDANLQGLCAPCHKVKTQREAARGRRRRHG